MTPTLKAITEVIRVLQSIIDQAPRCFTNYERLLIRKARADRRAFVVGGSREVSWINHVWLSENGDHGRYIDVLREHAPKRRRAA